MYLYILENDEIKRFYIGITNNPQRRIKEHNQDTKKYTGKVKGTWKLIYLRKYLNVTEAKKEENRLKKAKNRKYLNWYINHNSGR